jgi:hypothetical protein
MPDSGKQYVPATRSYTVQSLLSTGYSVLHSVNLPQKGVVPPLVSQPRDGNKSPDLPKQAFEELSVRLLFPNRDTSIAKCSFNASSLYLFSDRADLQHSLDIKRPRFVFETPTLN